MEPPESCIVNVLNEDTVVPPSVKLAVVKFVNVDLPVEVSVEPEFIVKFGIVTFELNVIVPEDLTLSVPSTSTFPLRYVLPT